MATVRMSRDVQGEIKNNARTAFIKSQPFEFFTEELADRIYRDEYKNHVEPIVKQLDELENLSFDVSKKSTYSLSLEGVDLSDYVDPKSIGHSYGPNRLYDTIQMSMSFEARFIEDRGATISLPKENPYHAEILTKLQNNERMLSDLDVHMEKIERVIEACSTINQFVKAWPAGAAHVPQEKLQKVNERSVRKQQADDRRALVEGMESDLNTSILTSSLLDD